ncbi:hypothetical protein V6N12_056959 [Hibiscus sabdariffa]|uniref:Exostosin GT47 domain-containing protein n=1 Tax=Hibiscus sabdariffa TaxID=183260 RepID=A0ABR2DCL8_9ROSI
MLILVMELVNGFRNLFRREHKRWVFLVLLVAITHLLFQSFLLPYGNAIRSLLPGHEDSMEGYGNAIIRVKSTAKSAMVRNPLSINSSDMSSRGVVVFNNVVLKDGNSSNSNASGDVGNGDRMMEDRGEIENDFASEDMDRVAVDRNFVDDDDDESENGKDLNEIAVLEDVIRDQDEYVNTTSHMVSSSTTESMNGDGNGFKIEQVAKHGQEVSAARLWEDKSSEMAKELGAVSTTSRSPVVSSIANQTSNAGSSFRSTSLQRDHAASENNSSMIAKPGKKKMRCEMPPKTVTTIDEMNHILLRHRRSSRAARPRRPSVRDQEIFAVRSQIENASVIMNDQDLYAPLFRNVSSFKRSYELMERTLRVYVYKDGKKPIFHLPILKGLYASEGWFMKLMQGNKRFLVKDPRRAHLFYMPFSSRMLEYTLYVRNSHNRTNLRQFMKDYTETIAAKYPYFNRTGGADHFLVACHDWAPYETRHHMEHCIKALCNADVTVGFKIGRDVSLPETYVRSARNPLRDLGGKPPSQRHILAFYAGGNHGYLRPILLKHWKDKDPDMKILGQMPAGVASKMTYIRYMKSSKYCICPKGYEVNSPRVVESIFYECVPVIISDNFVPPFFEVLDWGAFSLILAEKDIPNLKDILVSIPEERYLALQLGVRKVQRHFLWHAKPEKYDLFHMTLHSIWQCWKILMADLPINGGFAEPENQLSVHHDVVIVNNTSHILDFLLFSTPMDDIFTCLLTWTTNISRRFINFIENLVLQDVYRCREGSIAISSMYCMENSNSGICQRSSYEPEGEFLANTDSGIIKTNHCRQLRRDVPIFQGLMFPLFALRLTWRLVVAPWRCAFYYLKRTQAQVYSIVCRMERTLRGSSDDIGWLQRTPGMAPVEDGSARFLELLEAIRNGKHTLPNSFVYLLVPGLFSNHGPLYFVATKRFFSKMGLACHIAKIHSEASVEHNAWELKQYIEELYWGSGKRVMLLGHSKGGVDSAAALSIYWSELENKIAGLALVQSPYGGSPIASDTLREGQIADKETRRIMELLICKTIKGDMRALEDLTYEKRKEFVMKHKLPEGIPLISFSSEARVAPGVLATLTQIAHAELPRLPFLKFGSSEFDNVSGLGHQVPIVIPVSAAMAVCALHLLLRYGEKSDGLVTCRDAEVPGSVVVRPEQKLDHAWMVYSSKKKNPDEPNATEMCEALLTLLVELGERKEEERKEA